MAQMQHSGEMVSCVRASGVSVSPLDAPPAVAAVFPSHGRVFFMSCGERSARDEEL